MNYSLDQIGVSPRNFTGEFTIKTVHVFGLVEIIFILLVFVGLAYFYYYTHKHKDQCVEWKNDNGKIVNLYRLSNIMFWGGTAIIIVFGIIEILLVPK